MSIIRGKQAITTGSERSGVDISWMKRRKVIRIGGWYDSFVGIESEEMTLKDFLTTLGITLEDCQNALKDED